MVERMENGKNKENEELTSQEQKILYYLHTVNYGEVRIVINGGKPVRVEEIRQSFLL